MLWKISLLASKLAVLAALISTVPSTIYHYGKSEGLAVSLILVLFYFLKGFAQMFLGIKSPKMKDVVSSYCQEPFVIRSFIPILIRIDFFTCLSCPLFCCLSIPLYLLFLHG